MPWVHEVISVSEFCTQKAPNKSEVYFQLAWEEAVENTEA